MISKHFWCGALIVALTVGLATPALGSTLQDNAHHIEIGIVAVAAALVVVTVVLIHHYSKRSVTGCVASGATGMSVTDEKDMRAYLLSGDTDGFKPGERVKLSGKKIKPHAPGATMGWQATNAKDLGACPT